MTGSSLTYRLGTALVALLFGLGWGAPLGHAACAPMGPSSSDHCDTSGSRSHCEGDACMPSAMCLTQHASEDALTAPSPSPDGQGGGRVSAQGQPVVRSEVHSSLSPVGHVGPRAHRLHASVGVWLE